MGNPAARALIVVIAVTAALSCGGAGSRTKQASAAQVYAAACSSYAVGDLSSTLNHIRTLLRDYKRSPQAESARLLRSKIEKANRDAARRNARALVAKKDSALSRLHKEYDDMSELTAYYDRAAMQYAASHGGLTVGIGEKAGIRPQLVMRISYVADDWLFVESYKVKADSRRFTITPGLLEVERGNDAGGVWEMYSTTPGPEEVRMLRAIAESETARIRFVGRTYNKDRTITTAEKDGIWLVLRAYDLMIQTQP